MPKDGRAIRYLDVDPPAPGGAAEVAKGVLWLRMPMPMALDHVNLYALDDGENWTLIDTALDTRKTRALWEQALAGPLAGKPIKRVIVTHHHPDHIGLAGWFQSERGAELVSTRTAWLFARMLHLDEQPRPAEETIAFWKSAGMAPDVLAARMSERPFNFSDVISALPLGFTRIDEGSRISAGGREWIVRLGHGHAPDHATLWSEDEALVIGGDQLLPSISPNLGVYPTEPHADPVADWLASSERLKPFATDDQLVLPGHKQPYRGLPTRIDQLIENHVSALDRLEAFLAKPRTAVDCFDTLFKRPIGSGEYGLALVEAVAHCLHLWHAGRATRERRSDGAWLYRSSGGGHG